MTTPLTVKVKIADASCFLSIGIKSICILHSLALGQITEMFSPNKARYQVYYV